MIIGTLLKKEAVTQIQADLESAVEADRLLAETAATTSTTQAGIATTKAGEASDSALAAQNAYLQLPNTERALADLLAHLLGRIETLEQELAESKYNSMQIDTLSVVSSLQFKGAPLILTGTSAPAVTPDFEGQFFIVTGGATYQANGITNSGNWRQISN